MLKMPEKSKQKYMISKTERIKTCQRAYIKLFIFNILQENF